MQNITPFSAPITIGQQLQAEAERRAESMICAIKERLVPELVSHFQSQACRPQAIFLFGSVARGDPDPGSDADILVELDADMPQKTRRTLAREALIAADLPFACDVIVLTTAEIQRKRLEGNTFFARVNQEKRSVYEQV